MKKKTTINILLFLILLVSCSKTAKEQESQPGKNIKNRKYVGKLIKKNEFDFDRGKPVCLFTDGPDYWIADGKNQTVFKVDKEGHIKAKYGRMGGAPAENQRIKDIYIKGDSLGIIDNAKDVIKYMSLLGKDSVIFYQKFYDHIDRGKFLNNSLIAISNSEDDDLLINITDYAGQRLHVTSLKEITHYEDESIDLVYEGEFTRMNKNGYFVYFTYRQSFLVCFDSTGKVQYTSHTIDLFPPPKPAFEKYGEFTMHTVDPDIMVNLKADLNDNYLYILSNVIARKNKDKRALDVYNVSNGEYVHSIRVPVLEDGQIPLDFAVLNNDKNLVVVYDNFRIVEYELAYKE